MTGTRLTTPPATAGSLTPTTAGRTRAACSDSVASDRPAATATTRNWSGSPSRTSSAWRPIDPVEPRTATPSGRPPASGAGSADDGEDIQRDDRGGEQERVDPVEDPAVARDDRPGVLRAGGALQHGFGEVAGLGGEPQERPE